MKTIFDVLLLQAGFPSLTELLQVDAQCERLGDECAELRGELDAERRLVRELRQELSVERWQKQKFAEDSAALERTRNELAQALAAQKALSDERDDLLKGLMKGSDFPMAGDVRGTLKAIVDLCAAPLKKDDVHNLAYDMRVAAQEFFPILRGVKGHAEALMKRLGG